MTPSARLWRAHGLGNDYLVLHDGPALDPELVRAICDRHRGAGSDGVLEPHPSDRADAGVRIWNPDGSIAEKSGNGLRIYARYLAAIRGAPPVFRVDTGTDVVTCTVASGGVTVEMGRATLDPPRVPVLADAPVRDAAWTVDGDALTVTALATGNPHVVSFWERPLDEVPWRRLGEALERDPRFPNRTNVQFARITGPSSIDLRIWERGAGPTLASGSSSCAASAAAVVTGRLGPGRVTVTMPGGTLFVTVSADLDLVLEGPVEAIGWVDLDPDWLAARLPR